MAVEILKPGAITLIKKSLDSVFNKPTHGFLTGRAQDILFGNVPIMCNISDFAGKALCTQLKTDAGLPDIGDGILGFSLFGTVRLFFC